MISLKTEINPSDNYRKDTIKILAKFIIFCRRAMEERKTGNSSYSEGRTESGRKSLKQLDRENILAFLDSFRKPEASDPLHKWIGTYNLYRIHLLQFFKWLYSPDIEPDRRPKPSLVENIPQLKRKQKSIYKPADMWSSEDDLLFLKYCPSKRMKCFHTIAKDTSCRPHELLKLRIRDVNFKITLDKYQYAEVLVNGKTGSRPLVLIDSIPYLKDYLDHEHPQPGNPNAILLSGNKKSFGRAIGIMAVELVYGVIQKGVFSQAARSHPTSRQRIDQKSKSS
jgi:integrase